MEAAWRMQGTKMKSSHSGGAEDTADENDEFGERESFSEENCGTYVTTAATAAQVNMAAAVNFVVVPVRSPRIEISYRASGYPFRPAMNNSLCQIYRNCGPVF